MVARPDCDKEAVVASGWVKTGLGMASAMLLAAEPAAAHHVMDGAMPATFADGLLSGLGHPVIGLDHLAALVAVGCLAALQRRGALLAIGYVAAMLVGAASHVGAATIPASELLAALAVVVLGGVLIATRETSVWLALGLFLAAGLAHGCALGESIVGAQPAPLYAYFAGLALIQSAIALAVMMAARALLARPRAEPLGRRLVGAGIAGIGLVILAQQIMPGT
jgi:urease accessory protein